MKRSDDSSSPLIYCAADMPDIDRVHALAGVLARTGCGLKLGLEFFCARGVPGVRSIREAYPDLAIFLDLKFHDIPNTTAQALRAVVPLGISCLNVHAAGGADMMRAAVEAVGDQSEKSGVSRPKLLAVTVLTSLDESALVAVGQGGSVAVQVDRLALLARGAGADGVVCSAHEAERLRTLCGDDFILMVPGIRPAGAAIQDQKRTMTTAEARGSGATHLVIGRPITEAADPEAMIRSILSDMG